MTQEVVAEAAPNPVKVRGQVLDHLPEDLYIPPDALEVFLETFEGPLDVLLYLIRKQNLDILDIPILAITQQYVQYVAIMKSIKLELAADYLVMAALLAEIKSRMMLPQVVDEETGEEVDPRAELVRRLQDYERFKKASERLDAQPQWGRDRLPAFITAPSLRLVIKPPLLMPDLLAALEDIMQRASLQADHLITREPLSVRARMSSILARVSAEEYVTFQSLCVPEEGRMGVVVTFLALLELLKSSMLDLLQAETFAPIYIKSVGNHEPSTLVDPTYH